MPNWHDINDEIKRTGSTHDVIRRQYLDRLCQETKRNVIIYYSGWLQKPDFSRHQLSLNDADKEGFMAVIHRLDRSKGLDLLLHTPGGSAAATESLVDYLREMFGLDIRAIVPHLALSAGTMIACACKEIVMGKQSSLGPIDPQINGLPAHGIVKEFERAAEEIQANPARIPLWQPIIARYSPAFIGECEKAIDWSNQMVEQWLATGMFHEKRNRAALAKRIVKKLGDPTLTKSHSQQLSKSTCESIGLKIAALEDNDQLQDLVLSVHHACIHTLASTPAFKIIENHRGIAHIQGAQKVVIKG